MLYKRFRLRFQFAMICALLSSLALALIPLVNVEGVGSAKIFAYIVGAIFWLGVIAEQILFWLANSDRKVLERRLRRKNCKTIGKIPPGVLAFFRNAEATVSDIVLFIAAIIVAVLMIVDVNNKWLTMISIAIMFLSFNLHCLLNGKNYMYITTYRNYKKHKEQEENE